MKFNTQLDILIVFDKMLETMQFRVKTFCGSTHETSKNLETERGNKKY